MTTLKALSFAIGVALASVSAASAWETPGRGTQLRADLMDAMRPAVEWTLGASVQFVVYDSRGDYDPHVSDGSTLQVLFQRSGRQMRGIQPQSFAQTRPYTVFKKVA